MIETTTVYKCNVCGFPYEPDHIIGIDRNESGVLSEDYINKTEAHICLMCFTSLITQFEERCIAGITGCHGGPYCKSSHK